MPEPKPQTVRLTESEKALINKYGEGLTIALRNALQRLQYLEDTLSTSKPIENAPECKRRLIFD
jgi:tagatose-1,6-bisphosphate aldolase non-catalytic subunit AgaZ/GatZ